MKQGWEIKKLEELGNNKSAIVSGPFGSNLKVSDYKTEGIPILRLQNIGKGSFIEKDIKYISEEKAEELKYHSFISGDIALAKLGVPIGKTCIIPNHFKSGIITADIVRIRPDTKNIDYKYLKFFLNTDLSVAQLTGKISGATRPRVNLSNVRDIEIPLPPLPEQKRIVAILNKAFAAIAKAKANAEQNLNNAKELFESFLQGVFENKGEGWEEEKLGILGTLTSSKRIYKKEYVSKGVPFYRSKEIKELGHNKEITIELFIEDKRYEEIKEKFGVPTKGDILLTAVGTIGEMYVVQEGERFYFKDGNIMWLKGFVSLNTYFLKYALTAFVKKLKSMSRGAAYSALTIEKLKEYSIPTPSIAEQQTIVKKLDALSTETKKLEAIYQQKVEDLEELKKSVLQKAFKGEL